ncbi:hypothetical protein J4455_01375 [Candidatus Woesearchaeota archaeon]|nr:hypothetical protein [Candidatus Woesearchaeota archaeon]
MKEVIPLRTVFKLNHRTEAEFEAFKEACIATLVLEDEEAVRDGIDIMLSKLKVLPNYRFLSGYTDGQNVYAVLAYREKRKVMETHVCNLPIPSKDLKRYGFTLG